MKVSLYNILDTMQAMQQFDDVLAAFEKVQAITHCSTGCGGCHDKVIKIISDAMYGYDSEEPKHCKI